MPASVGYEHIFLFSPIDPCTTWCPTSACLWKAAAALLSRELRPLHRAVNPSFPSHVELHATSSIYTETSLNNLPKGPWNGRFEAFLVA